MYFAKPWKYFHGQTNEFAITIWRTNIVYLKTSANIKFSTFLEKMGVWGVDHDGLYHWNRKSDFDEVFGKTKLSECFHK